MDPGPPENKRPRLGNVPAWSAGPRHGICLFNPTPSSPLATQLAHHPPPTTPGQYQPSHSFPRPAEHPPPPPHPHPHPQPQPHSHQHQQPQPQPPHPPPPTTAAPGPPPPHHPDDRRHHEPDRYVPMHEHRHPPPSPAHPSYPGFPPPRDPMVKPDPGEDTLPQLRRPPSTSAGSGHELPPGTPHPIHPHQDDRRPMSFDAAPPQQQQHPQQQQQQPLYRQHSYPPQTPLPHPQQPYEYPPSYAGPHADIQYAIPITATGKRKAQRASQACDSCRQLKAKCDETKPCKSCKEKKLECKYKDPAPKQQDKASSDILDGLDRLHSAIRELTQRIGRVERVVQKSTPGLDLEAEPMQEDDIPTHRPMSAGSGEHMADDGYSSSPGDIITSPEFVADTAAPTIDAQEARKIARQIVDDDEREAIPGPQVLPGTPAIPLDHTTLAGLLLKWKAIQNLVQHHLDREGIEYIEEFPIRQEERRGLLRVFGRGEGQDSARGDRDAAIDQVVADSCDGYSDTGAPSPADCWGSIGGPTPPSTISGKSTLGPSSLDFTEASVWKYVRSYEENIQNMHPLIIPNELHAMVKVFLDNIQQKSSKGPGEIAKFATTNVAPQAEPGSKRKRQSPGPDGSDAPTPSTPKPKPAFQRSIQNAIVLLVLALGRICLWKDKKLPDPVPVTDPSHGSPQVRNGHPASPHQGSPPSNLSHSQSSGLPSPKEGVSASRRASFQGNTPTIVKPPTSMKRNMDVIPGLGYFAVATDILGAQLAGSTLRHVHANILAGLYHGQLGRVMESYSYIRQASFALQIKLRPSLHRLSELPDPTAITVKSDNQLIVAFWSCLQLESDIIAELPLPQSQILTYEYKMPYPNLNLAVQHGFDIRVVNSYHAQLYLRKRLNEIHQLLYDPKKRNLPLHSQQPEETNIIKRLQENLDMSFVPSEFAFDLHEAPATEILSARLRAKYWGAQAITFRPFVKQILDFNSDRSAGTTGNLAYRGFGGQFSGPIIGPDVTHESDINPEIMGYAKKGIQALIESTRAFHNLEDKRFVITNVFGTAHAQWGNLIILAAVYKDPTLSKHIDEGTLRTLFARTIQFFQTVALASSALAIDMRILQGLDRELWYNGNVEMADVEPHSSFSSNTSGGHFHGFPHGLPVTPSGPAPPGMHAPGTPVDGILAPPLPVHHPM